VILEPLVWLALAAAPAQGQTAADLHINELAVYYRFEHEPQGAVIQALEEETALILSPTGESISWRPMEGGTSSHWHQ
jgi:hypothetical protein